MSATWPPLASRSSTATSAAHTVAVLTICCTVAAGCEADAPHAPTDHGPIAESISGPLGVVGPWATEAQRETFERGLAVSERRFSLADGLGPAFNVTFCGACHEKPTPGGSAGRYRDFHIGGTTLSDGSFVAAVSSGAAGGVIRLFEYGEGADARPALDPDLDVLAKRNPIPFFGVGLLAELSDAVILERSDEFDADGDGISGRPNYDRGFVGRFGRKAQTVSIEGFIRGPLFNHLGITTDPLTDEQKAALPVDSSGTEAASLAPLVRPLAALAQAAAPAQPLTDLDDAPDPELSTDDLFDLVSFAMLLAAPEVEPETAASTRGREQFDAAGCDRCHTPRLEGPRGPLPVYSDLLLHDMGPELADGVAQGLARGYEFRTQPLWGIAPVGPYLHDGRADTVEQAIEAHGGEAAAARDAFLALDRDARDDLIEFLWSLGGRSQRSLGLLPPDAPMPEVGAYAGPRRSLDATELALFSAGRELFDREFGLSEGLGQPRFNGDSCRACHFEPTLGGAGPRGVNVMRHGLLSPDGSFIVPAVGTILHKESALPGHANGAQPEAQIFEHRQTPHLFGLGLIEALPDDVIIEAADPDDTLSPDGISGRVSWTDGGRIGRLGWKAQVPDVTQFVRDAVSAELGVTLPWVEGHTFGLIHDKDDVADPELGLEEVELLTFFLRELAPPPRQAGADAADAVAGEAIFDEIGCAACHTPELLGPDGPVPLYSDLLLHEVLPPDALGIEDASASMREFRTAPLWGIATTAPYLHNGSADTLAEAIAAHFGEADGSREGYEALTDADREALLAFLETL